MKIWKWNEITAGDLATWECLANTERPRLEIIVDGDSKTISVYE